jgi:molybdenum transport protein
MSGIATFTHHLVLLAKEINPNITVSTTRKNFPGSKELMLKAIISGGGVPHRLGLYDSILIFKEHIEFFADRRELEKKFTLLKHKFLEKRITVEVETFEEAKYFALLGVDILQCEKMDFQTLQKCVELKKDFPNILLSATGGIHEKNIQEYVKTGVDFIVTSSPYHAKPTDIKVEMKADKPWLFVNSL